MIGRYTEILYTKNGLEYFLRADGKIASRPVDAWRDYRRDEIAPEVADLVDEARAAGRYLSKAAIDGVLQYQAEDPHKAAAYIKYRYLGQATYIDVYGRDAERDERRRRKEAEEAALAIERQLESIQRQLTDMQKLIFNMAKQFSGSGPRKAVNY